MVKVELQATAAQRAIEGFEKQLPFFTARALTRTARDAAGTVKSHLGDHFELRTTWLQRGIRFDKATKRSLTSVVGSKDRFMRLQAMGGEKQGQGKTGTVAVPITGGPARPSFDKKITPAKLPAKLLRATKGKNKPFVAPVSAGSKEKAIWRRLKKSRYPIAMVYKFDGSVKYQKRWPLKQDTLDAVRKVWPAHAVQALEDALAEAAKRAGAKLTNAG